MYVEEYQHKGASCPWCGHPPWHALVRTGDTEDHGGVIVCPIKGCTCFMPWAPDGGEVHIPDAEHWAAILARVQTAEETGRS